MQKESTILNKLRELKEAAWQLPVKDSRSHRFAKKYAAKTSDLINEGVKALGQEAEETEKMARSFFRMLEAKLDLSGRTDPPTEEEVKEAIEQLKDVGRFSIFTTLVILPGGVVSLLGLELLARKFGIRGFNLIPSSFRKKKKSNLPDFPHNTVPALLILLLAGALLAGCKKEDPVVASFSADLTEVMTGERVQFINFSENATYYQWDFGDGESSIRENPTHAYKAPGEYTVSLVSIGLGDADTASLDIDVIQPYNVTIYEGLGIEGANLSDSWSIIRTSFTSDTTSFYYYLEEDEVYIHIVYYFNEGVAFAFPSADTVIHDQDSLEYIFIVPPYPGATTKGIVLESTMDRVVAIYGQPDLIDEGDGIEGYFYFSLGVVFFTYDSGVVDEINVFSNAAKKSIPPQSWKPPPQHGKIRAYFHNLCQ